MLARDDRAASSATSGVFVGSARPAARAAAAIAATEACTVDSFQALWLLFEVGGHLRRGDVERIRRRREARTSSGTRFHCQA